ncbi:hypothetical protein K8R62_02390, partial [bacterium]|nr:hypothetical protein [bacterium]
MKNLVKNFLIFFIVFLSIALLFSSFSGFQSKDDDRGINYLAEKVQNEEVSKILIQGEEVTVTLKNGEEQEVKKEKEESLSATLSNLGVGSDKISQIDIVVED